MSHSLPTDSPTPSPSFTCGYCGHSPVNLDYTTETRQSMIRRGACFTCNFWLDRLDQYNSPRCVVINNNMYHIDNWSSPGRMRGYGGRVFHIKRHDSDQIVTTNNLWHNGDIPERFHHLMPDNAVFIAPLPADDSLVVCGDPA